MGTRWGGQKIDCIANIYMEAASDDERQKITKQEFIEKTEIYKTLMEYSKSFDDYLLKIKLTIISFVGVLLTIVFAKKDEFSSGFIQILARIVALSFLLFTIETFIKYRDISQTLKNYHQKTLLAKIRHIAATRKSYYDYAARAEQLLIEGDEIEQAILNKESIPQILKFKDYKILKFIFFLWLLTLMSIPTLFLAEVSGFWIK
ncbi:MAG: hypothetical protein G01um101431_757 [Parcubacteria group bacterium Gr01-1014_31]|nr:MAG: hypothetical protein G01um101431_757 [Parcubacteria group bacterium Gr01-1014_31]